MYLGTHQQNWTLGSVHKWRHIFVVAIYYLIYRFFRIKKKQLWLRIKGHFFSVHTDLIAQAGCHKVTLLPCPCALYPPRFALAAYHLSGNIMKFGKPFTEYLFNPSKPITWYFSPYIQCQQTTWVIIPIWLMLKMKLVFLLVLSEHVTADTKVCNIISN